MHRTKSRVKRLLDNVKNEHGTRSGHKIVDGADAWEVEKILKERRWRGQRQYLVDCAGNYRPSWELARNILDDEIIDGWERQKRRAGKKSTKKPKKKPGPPYVLTVASVARASAEVQIQRRDDAEFMDKVISKALKKALWRQTCGSKSPHLLFQMDDISEWLFVGRSTSGCAPCMCDSGLARARLLEGGVENLGRSHDVGATEMVIFVRNTCYLIAALLALLTLLALLVALLALLALARSPPSPPSSPSSSVDE